jgi:hypothetical protein
MGQNKRSFKASACIPFTTFSSNLGSGLTCWVHSHAVKVPVTSTTKVSFSNHDDAKTNKAKVSFSNNADAKTNNASSFRHTASSTLQLVVASVNDKFSKGSNKSNNVLPFGGKPNKSIDGKSTSSTFQLVVALIPILDSEGAQASQSNFNDSKISLHFRKDCVAEYFVREIERMQTMEIIRKKMTSSSERSQTYHCCSC